jgi:DNA-binding response OmpR family regulator
MASATILLIDTDADSLTIYSTLLRHHGYDVLHAADAETGLRLAVELRPDLVVSELFLPPLHRGEVVRRLRKDHRTAGTPVIVLDSIPKIARELLQNAGVSRLSKPCKPSRLLEEVERLLDRPAPADH